MAATQTYTTITFNPPFGMVMPNRSWEAASADGYRFGFNGMEGDSEIKAGQNSVEFGSRFYDPRIGKWLKTDPFQSSSHYISPYAYALNNPIRYIDPKGEKVELSFENESAKEAYIKIMNESLEGEFEIDLTLTDNGSYMLKIVSVMDKGDKSKLSEGALEFYTISNDIIDDPIVTAFQNVVYGSDAAMGDYQSNTLDIKDVEAFQKQTSETFGSTMSRSTWMIHEMREQYSKAKRGMKVGEYSKEAYDEDHKDAIENAENKVGGYIRHSDFVKSTYDDGSVKEGGTYIEGKDGTYTKVTITFDDTEQENIIDIKEIK